MGEARIGVRPPGDTAAGIIGDSWPTIELRRRIGVVADSHGTVLIVGETGVGKELVADSIHRASPRRAQPLVKVALAAMPRELLESELFGHEKGAFTNAVTAHRGLFELADSGTLFLDDIDDVPLPVQTKLLRVLECGEAQPVGDNRTRAVDVRIIAASKVDLSELVARDRFREDLYYRLNVLPIGIAPLRERRSDILPPLRAPGGSAGPGAGPPALGRGARGAARV